MSSTSLARIREVEADNAVPEVISDGEAELPWDPRTAQIEEILAELYRVVAEAHPNTPPPFDV